MPTVLYPLQDSGGQARQDTVTTGGWRMTGTGMAEQGQVMESREEGARNMVLGEPQFFYIFFYIFLVGSK